MKKSCLVMSWFANSEIAEIFLLGRKRPIEYGYLCEIEKLTQRITRLLCRREHVLKELRKLEQ